MGYLVLALLLLLQGGAGGKLARDRGRSILWWGVLSALFPIFIMVIYFEKPLKEVPGGFRLCPACGEFNPWRQGHCTYCGAPIGTARTP